MHKTYDLRLAFIEYLFPSPYQLAFAKSDPIYWPAKQSKYKGEEAYHTGGESLSYESVYSELPREFS